MKFIKNPLGLAIAVCTIFQHTVATATPAPTIEEIIVTGSRIQRANIDSVGPVTVLTEADIAATGITSLEVLLQKLPSAAGFAGNQTSAYWVSNGWGTPQINLRGLGINRTLVLLNGRRIVFGGTGANSSVDLSLIPMSLISRIEVLKDGASAIYGADAVAGVVNLITKESIDGLEIQGKFGMTDENDGKEKQIDLSWGKTSEKGSLMINLSYQDNEAMPLADRVPCPLSSTSKTICSGSSSTIGGRTTLPAGATLPDGTVLLEPTRINFNQDPNGSGDNYEIYDGVKHGFNYNPYFNAVQPIERINAAAFGSYQLSKHSRLFTELMYSDRQTKQPASPATLKNIAYSSDHPTNPTGSDFILERRRLLENGARNFVQDVKTWRIVAGIDGNFNNRWSYNAALNWGRNTASDEITNNINMAKVNQTLDTTTCGVNGIPCADYLGYGDVSQEALDYIVFNQKGTGGNRQLSFTANISGELAELPAGMLGLAAGIEWREEKGWRDPDPLVVAGDALGNQSDSISGKTEVREIYGELHIPLLSGLLMVQSLDMDLAARYSDYDLFDAEDTYKVGINWQIVNGLKLRGTLTSAFRVPNVPELFGGVSQGNLITIDPCSEYASLDPSSALHQNCQAAGVPISYTQLGNTILTDRGGNTALQPESAETYTIGLVIQPMEGLSFTVDYFDIDIDDAVREISGSTKLASCYNSAGLSHEFCSSTHHTRNPVNSDINYLSTQKFNTGREVMQGVDIGMLYQFDVLGLSNAWDFQATYLKKYESTAFDGEEPQSIDGYIGGGNGGYPHWRANTSLTAQGQRWSGTYSVQMIGKGSDFNKTSGIGSEMPTVFYHNAQFSYQLSDAAKLSIGLDNIFDKEPPRVASWTDGNTDTMTYDLAGRRGYVRVSYKFN